MSLPLLSLTRIPSIQIVNVIEAAGVVVSNTPAKTSLSVVLHDYMPAFFFSFPLNIDTSPPPHRQTCVLHVPRVFLPKEKNTRRHMCCCLETFACLRVFLLPFTPFSYRFFLASLAEGVRLSLSPHPPCSNTPVHREALENRTYSTKNALFLLHFFPFLQPPFPPSPASFSVTPRRVQQVQREET